MFSLLWGLLFRPRVTMESILKTPNLRQSSQLSFLIVMLLMVNVVFLFATTPQLDTLGYGKWVIAFFIPPFQFWLQRTIFFYSARLGLLMFSGSRLPRDPLEKRQKLALVNYVFPYVIYPLLFCTIVSSIFEGIVVPEMLMLIGLISMFVLTTMALKQIYNVSTAPAFWGPFLVQFLISIVLALLIGLIAMVYLLLTHASGI